MQNENKLCLIVVSFLPTYMNHIRQMGLLLTTFVLNICPQIVHLDRAIGVVQSVTCGSLILILWLFVGINEDLFWEREKQRSF